MINKKQRLHLIYHQPKPGKLNNQQHIPITSAITSKTDESQTYTKSDVDNLLTRIESSSIFNANRIP